MLFPGLPHAYIRFDFPYYPRKVLHADFGAQNGADAIEIVYGP